MFGAMERDQKRARALRPGDEVSGTVVKIGADSVFVDLGGKSEGIIDKAELCDPEGTLRVAVGEKLRAFVAALRDGQVLLRTRLGGKALAGDEPGAELFRAHENGIPVVGKVKAVNKGGVEVDIGGVTAFCPISQLDAVRVEDASGYVGQELTFRVTSVERGERPRAVLSRRVLLEAERAAQARELVQKLEVGAVVKGKVTRLQPFGAFVDIGGVEGLLHKSELGIARTGNVASVLAVGAEIDAVVSKIEASEDPKKPARIGLSLRQLATHREAEDAKSFQRPTQGLGTLGDVLGRLGGAAPTAPGKSKK